MYRIVILLFISSLAFNSAASTNDSTDVKPRKLTYSDFLANYSVNDTSAAVIELFFDKKDNSAKGQMSFLPITLAIYPLFPLFSVGLTVVSLPLFVNGSVIMIKYRKGKLVKVLSEYRETGKLPKWVRKKVNKSLHYEQFNYE